MSKGRFSFDMLISCTVSLSLYNTSVIFEKITIFVNYFFCMVVYIEGQLRKGLY